jgi:hypothetical protein
MNTRCGICTEHIQEGQNKFALSDMVNTHIVCWDQTYLCPACGADSPDGVMFACECNVYGLVGSHTVTGSSRGWAE